MVQSAEKKKQKRDRQVTEGVQNTADYRAEMQSAVDRIPALKAARLARAAAKTKRKAK